MPQRPTRVRLALTAAFAAALLCAFRLAPQGRDAVKIETQAVAGPVHMLVGQGGNIGVSAGPDGLFVIDDQFAELAPKIRAALDALDGAGAGAPRFLLNTHHHGDHTGGNVALGAEAVIVAHDNVRARLAAGPNPTAQAGLPLVTFGADLSLHLNGERVHAVHYPAAHTDSDSVVFFEGSKVVHMGDLFFHERFPFIDLDSGGSLAGLQAGVADVLARTDDAWRVIPGHGPLATRADLAAYAQMLERSAALVREALAGGDDVAAMLHNGLLADYESLSWEFITTQRWLETLVRDLSKD
jgi:cyclase